MFISKMSKKMLSDYINWTNFDNKHPSCNVENRIELGFLKSENDEKPIKECICFAVKKVKFSS